MEGVGRLMSHLQHESCVCKKTRTCFVNPHIGGARPPPLNDPPGTKEVWLIGLLYFSYLAGLVPETDELAVVL